MRATSLQRIPSNVKPGKYRDEYSFYQNQEHVTDDEKIGTVSFNKLRKKSEKLKQH